MFDGYIAVVNWLNLSPLLSGWNDFDKKFFCFTTQILDDKMLSRTKWTNGGFDYEC